MVKIRLDDDGLFWKNKPPERGNRSGFERPLPPVPDTGWKPPRDFPNLSAAKVIGIDTETKDPNLRDLGPGCRRDDSYVVGLSVATEDGHAWYFPVRHEMGGNMDPEQVMRWARDQLSGTQPKVGANIMYDLDWLATEGVDVAGPFIDVQHAEPLLDEFRRSYALDVLAEHYLGDHKVSDELYRWCSIAFGGRATARDQGKNIWRAPVELVGPYAEVDAVLPIRIYEKQKVLLEQQGLMQVFDMECRLIPLMLAMRQRGVRVDFDRAQEINDVMLQKERQAQERLDNLVGFHVNANPSKSLYAAFDKLGIGYATTDAGNPSITKAYLEALDHPIAELILGVRKWSKNRGTFVDGYINKHTINGRIHAQFHQLKSDDSGTVSGRFSSSTPNLQNIPSRDEEVTPLVRSLFIPDEGHQWRRYDWSQIEYRFLVHYARGESGRLAKEMYRNNPDTDFHRFTQKLILEMAGKEIKRKPIKNINFGLVYGMGEPKLAQQIGIPLSEAMPIFHAYHDAVDFVKDLFDYCERVAQNRGHVRTILNRRARFPFWEPADFELSRRAVAIRNKDMAEEAWGAVRRAHVRAALNRILQGGAAEMMKKAMVDIWEAGLCDVVGIPLLTVHDELDFSDPMTKESEEGFREVKRIMETCIPLSVPVIAECEVGPNWGSLRELK